MANFVLVHGAFAGAWFWDHTISKLQDAGHKVAAPDLPGAGEDHTPLSEVTLEAAVQRVLDTLRAQNGPAILVGHSMGGVVITQAAAIEPQLVSKLVYVAAFRPVDGESLLDLTGRPEGSGDGVQSNITVEGDPPVATFDSTMAMEVLFHDVPGEIAAKSTEQLAPQPLALFATPVNLGDAQLPLTEYVVCNQDRAIPPALQHFMAQRSATVVHELESSHSPLLSMPDRVVELLLNAT